MADDRSDHGERMGTRRRDYTLSTLSTCDGYSDDEENWSIGPN